jgi:hypothetical protein
MPRPRQRDDESECGFALEASYQCGRSVPLAGQPVRERRPTRRQREFWERKIDCPLPEGFEGPRDVRKGDRWLEWHFAVDFVPPSW